ncbi:MAG TPA: hypothetical protein VML50_06800 [Anaeromyxobacter sp.]|nr:hypothetical protein [Anaeromyxobacter sp.]HTN52095.1 hypothetical protein [Anaeromyxobacter sp.]
MRRVLTAVALTAALAGCPIPQPLPEYKSGSVTPPRILQDEITVGGVKAVSQPITPVPISSSGVACPTKPSYELAVRLVDTNTIEQVEARWFVDYVADNTNLNTPRQDSTVPASPDQSNVIRVVPPYHFVPYDFDTTPGQPGTIHVVELVVSNNFDPAGVAADPPNRAPATGFESQTFRWIFETVVAPCPP